MLKKYEYKMLTINFTGSVGSSMIEYGFGKMEKPRDFNGLEELFNKLGSEGWELVGFQGPNYNYYYFVFKREISE